MIQADYMAHRQDEPELEILTGMNSPARVMTGKAWSKPRKDLRNTLANRRKPR